MDFLISIFEEYGWMGIVGILICLIIFFVIKLLYKKIFGDVSDGLEKIGEKLTDQMAHQNDKLMDCIVNQHKQFVDYLINKDTSDKVNHNNMLNERINLSEDINIALKDIMNIHNAQRAFIIEFHNSYQNMSGVPFAKYSCTYEWFEKGLEPMTAKCVSLPFSILSKIVYETFQSDSKQVVYTDMKKMEEEHISLFSLLGKEKENIKAIVYSAMFDNKNQLIGFLVLEYRTPLNKAHLNLEQLKIQTAELTSILNIRYKYSS